MKEPGEPKFPFDSEGNKKIVEALTAPDYEMEKAVRNAGGNFDTKEIDPRINAGFPRIEQGEPTFIMLTPGSINKVLWDTLLESCPELELQASLESKDGSISDDPDIYFVNSTSRQGLEIFKRIMDHPMIQALQVEIYDPSLEAEFNPNILDEETAEKCYARFYKESPHNQGMRKPKSEPLTDEEAKEIIKKVITEVYK